MNRGAMLAALRRRIHLGGTAMRLAGIAFVFLLAIAAFAMGVGTRQIPDIGEEPLLAWLYYAASLFVLGGTDIGVPSDQGPLAARIALWAAFLLAPLITTTVVADAVIRLLRRGESRRPPVDHVLLVGSDALALAYLAAVRDLEPGREVVLLTHDASAPTVMSSKPEPGSPLRQVRGNALSKSVMQSVGINGAYRAVVLTGDDTLNLECAWALRELNPTLPVAAHVGDLSLLRPVNRVLRSSQETQGPRPPAVFSTHRMAALQLFESYLEPLFSDTADLDDVIVAGFDRLGQTLLEILLLYGAGEIARLFVVDPRAARLFRQFESDVATEELTPQIVEGALDDPGTWDQPLAELSASGLQGVALVTADAPTNLRIAMLLRQRSQSLRIFVVAFRHSPFLEVMSRQIGFELLCLEEMLTSALRDHFEALTAG